MERIGNLVEGLLDNPAFTHPSVAVAVRERQAAIRLQADNRIRLEHLRNGTCSDCGTSATQCECGDE